MRTGIREPRRRPGTAAPIVPQGVLDLEFWHNLDAGVDIVSGKIASVADLSGNGHTLAQSVAGSRPTVATVNGHRVARHGDGTPSNLWLEYSTPFAMTPDMTIFAVIRYKEGTTNQILFSPDDITLPPYHLLEVSGQVDNLHKPFMSDGVNAAVVEDALVDGELYVVRWSWKFTGDSILRCVVNGGTVATEVPSAETPLRNFKNVGILEGTTIHEFIGDWFELRGYARDLSASEIARIESHLFDKYEITP